MLGVLFLRTVICLRMIIHPPPRQWRYTNQEDSIFVVGRLADGASFFFFWDFYFVVLLLQLRRTYTSVL